MTILNGFLDFLVAHLQNAVSVPQILNHMRCVNFTDFVSVPC
jgi:hypothetical protein